MSPELQIDLFVATFRRHARKQPRLTIMYCSLGLALQGVEYIMQPFNLFAFLGTVTLLELI